MQEQMNSVNDSGECQEVESNHSGRLSYVSTQPAAIPSSRSVLSRDKKLPPGTKNTSGPQEIVLGNPFSTVDSSRNRYQGVRYSTTQGATGSIPVLIGTGDSGARDEDLTRDTIPMPTFATKPLTTSSTIPVDFPQNSMLGQQRLHISELQFDNFPTHSTFPCWKMRFKKKQVTTCYDFPSETMLWIK